MTSKSVVCHKNKAKDKGKSFQFGNEASHGIRKWPIKKASAGKEAGYDKDADAEMVDGKNKERES